MKTSFQQRVVIVYAITVFSLMAIFENHSTRHKHDTPDQQTSGSMQQLH